MIPKSRFARNRRRQPNRSESPTTLPRESPIAQDFDRAVALHQAGRIDAAREIYGRILRVDPTHANALHLMGVAANQHGRHEEAVNYIRRAIDAYDLSAPYHYNLGNAYRDLNRHDQAVAAYRRAVELQPSLAEAHFALANILKAAGRSDQAQQCYLRALKHRPDFVDAHYNLGNLYLTRGRLDEAEQSYRQALQVQPHYAEVHGNLAHVYELRGETDKAIASYRRALELKPNDTTTLNSLGNVFKLRGEFADAALHYRKALRIDPGLAVVHSNLGAALQQMRKYDEAIASYHQALELNPRLVNTYGNLASLHETSNRLDQAVELAQRGLAIDADNPLCNLVVGKCLRREKQYEQAIAQLTRVLPRVEKCALAKDFHYELGQLYERLKRSDEAFPHFSEGNRISARNYSARNVDASRYTREIDVLLKFFTERNPADWTPVPPFDPDQTPYFLVGFPRSGTTLLDQILDSHPKLQTLEEKPAVAAMKKIVLALPDRYPAALAYLTPAQTEKIRDAYFSTVDQWVRREPHTRLVDKFPLNTINMGLLMRVFPATRFIVAIRHPCDCTLSCFMQEFEANDAMANFVTLEQSAALYDRVMRLFRRYVEAFPVNFHVIRYEDVVADMESETRRLLQFLDVEWNDSVLSFNQHARERGKINTPSYHQVTEPIYRRARYRWLRYAKQMEPVMPLLGPHIEYFGYQDVSESDEHID